MFGFTPFILPAILNAPQLFRGDVGGYVGNVGIGGTTGNLLNNIVPGDVLPSATPSFVSGYNPPLASNIAGNLIGPDSVKQGILSNASNATSIGGANLLNNVSQTATSNLPLYIAAD